MSKGCCDLCFEEGAAVAFGLMGMAEAIRDRNDQRSSAYHYERYAAAASRYAAAIGMSDHPETPGSGRCDCPGACHFCDPAQRGALP